MHTVVAKAHIVQIKPTNIAIIFAPGSAIVQCRGLDVEMRLVRR